MPVCPCDERPSRVPTRLESALARLNRVLGARARDGEAMESMFAQWQGRWASRRDDIVRRLEAIDSQLEIWRPSTEPTPRFAVVSASEEAGNRSADVKN